ncbi:anti-sigma factor [Salinicola lusitanus]|uniref:Anti-sigma factor n=1 Tax=Salinicola lusitanus TaxID=1949085 RepID=A0ABZ3CTP7_9GAMM
MHDTFRLTDPEEREMAAGEYVLGTLTGAQRAEFEALLAVSADLQHSVEAWRERLQLLNQQLEPVAPPKRVWPDIAARLGLRTGPLQRLGFWRAFSGIATAAALILAIVALVPREPAMMPGEYVFVINQPNGQTAWILNATLDGKMMVQAISPEPMPEDKGGELWMMENGTPVSLGMLPNHGEATMQLPAKMLGLMKTADFAVSMEPREGAPGGKPTGPVIDAGKLVQIRSDTVSL